MKHSNRKLVLTLLLAGVAALAQEAPATPPPPGTPAPPEAPPPPMQPRRPPMERAFHRGGQGRWWHNPEMAQKLGLSSEQEQKMDEVFQQHRLHLIDLNAALEKEEALLEPLMESDHPDEAKINAQAERVAKARAELEVANTVMLVEIRIVLTHDQWKKLQSERPGPRAEGREHGPGEPR